MRRLNLKNSRARKNRRGFTLTEIMLVLVILSILAGLVVVSATGTLGSAKKKAAQTQISSLASMVNTYLVAVGSLPTALKDLHEQPSNLANPQQWDQISDKPVGLDPWNNEYIYTVNGMKFEIRSNGPDGQPNTSDDLSSSAS